MAGDGQDDPRVGPVLAKRYRAVRLVRRGAWADVYDGENVRIGKRVAIRFPRRDGSDESSAARLAEEARVAGGIHDPHVLETIDLGRSDDGEPFLVSEPLEGTMLEAIERPVPLPRALGIGCGIAAGLGALHRARGPHRSVHPGCFLVTPGGTTKLVDLGVTPADEVHWRPFAPPVPTGDERDDVWSVGAILGWLTEGTTPGPLGAVLERCTGAVDRRFGTMKELENALEALRKASSDPRSPAAEPRPPTPPRLAAAPGFREARDDYAFELSDVLAAVRPDASVKGLFLQTVVDRVGDRAALFARARVPDRRIVPFLDFPYHDYMRVLVAAAEMLHPDVPRTVALRRFHHPFYEAFAETLPGRVIFGVLGRDASRILPVGPRGWQVNLKHLGEVRGHTVGPRHVRYEYSGYPALVCECCDVGVVEGALAFLGERGQVRIRTPRPDHAELDITW